MNPVASEREYTPEDLLTLPDGDCYELVDGKLVERHMGFVSDWIAGKLHHLIFAYCETNPCGWVTIPNSGGFQGLPGSARTVRKPDVAFVSYGRFPQERLPPGHAQLAPDLAVEIISPNDLYEDVDQKIEEYLRAQVRLVWIISPRTRTVRVHRLNGSCQSVREQEELNGEDVLPGFRVRVATLFQGLPADPAGNGG